MAYFAASQISVFLAEQFGFSKVAAHLPLWAAGKATPEVVAGALGIDTAELDKRFHAWLKPRLAHYDKQFVPDLKPPKSLDEARTAAKNNPGDASKLVKLALALLAAGNQPEAMATLQLALRKIPTSPTRCSSSSSSRSTRTIRKARGSSSSSSSAARTTGYSVRMRAADIAEAKEDQDGMKKHFFKAHRFDPLQAEPLQALYDLARKQKDEQGQLWALQELSKLDQHDRRVWFRLLTMLVKRGKWKDAVKVGESAIYVDVANPRGALVVRPCARETGRHVSAIFEMNSALIAGAPPKLATTIYERMAEGYAKLGKAQYAAKAKQYAQQMKGFAPPSGDDEGSLRQ